MWPIVKKANNMHQSLTIVTTNLEHLPIGWLVSIWHCTSISFLKTMYFVKIFDVTWVLKIKRQQDVLKQLLLCNMNIWSCSYQMVHTDQIFYVTFCQIQIEFCMQRNNGLNTWNAFAFILLLFAFEMTVFPLVGDVPAYLVPPEVKSFIMYFHKQVVDQVLSLMHLKNFNNFCTIFFFFSIYR